MILPGSYTNGFAPRDGQPLYPELWRGCVGAWAPCLGPTGLTLLDWSGRVNHGTASTTAAAIWQANQGKYAARSDATYFDIVSGLDKFAFIQNTLRFTISYWQRIDSLSARTGAIGTAAASAEKGFFVINEFGAGNGTNAVYISVQYGTVGQQSVGMRSADNTLKLGWQHIAITCNGSNAETQFYIDGKLTAKTTVGGTGVLATGNSNRNLNIGRVNHSASFLPYAGFLDDVRIYDYAMADPRALSLRRGIAYEMAPRRRSSSAVQFNRRRRLLVGA